MQNYDQAAMLSCQQDPPGVIKDQVRCCSAEIGMGSIVASQFVLFNFNTDICTDTYILACYPEPPIGLQTSLYPFVVHFQAPFIIQ